MSINEAKEWISMSCTTILVGKKASYDGSTLMARDDDSGPAAFCPKRFVVVKPEEQPRQYKSKLSGVEITLPDDPMRYTCMPNVKPERGIWGEAGINACNVAMSETETLTSNPRVLGADPLDRAGIGEEDLLTIVLPYIHTAREGVLRLGSLIEQFGTYEMNGIGFQDVDEIWWLESVGGHHWMARRVPDEAYVVNPNQQGIDSLDLVDAFGAKKENLCSSDMIGFIRENHLDLVGEEPLEEQTAFDTRAAFGSHTDHDHSYNTPRAWYMERYFNPSTFKWEGPDADYLPESDDIPWCMIPEKRITVEDVKYILSSYYQGTEFNPYNQHGESLNRGRYRPIGINRNTFVAITQLRPYAPKEAMAVEWLAVGSNAFNAAVPFYANVETTPEYLANTTETVSTENFYWTNRLIASIVDAHYHSCIADIDRYKYGMLAMGHAMLKRFDDGLPAGSSAYLAEANDQIAAEARRMTNEVLGKVLDTASRAMKNAYTRDDA